MSNRQWSQSCQEQSIGRPPAWGPILEGLEVTPTTVLPAPAPGPGQGLGGLSLSQGCSLGVSLEGNPHPPEPPCTHSLLQSHQVVEDVGDRDGREGQHEHPGGRRRAHRRWLALDRSPFTASRSPAGCPAPVSGAPRPPPCLAGPAPHPEPQLCSRALPAGDQSL